MGKKNLDDTIDDVPEKSEAKVPKVVNTPSSDSDSWSWDWNTDADAIIDKLGYAGLAKACAWYDSEAPDDNGDGYPDRKSDYKLPHHKLIDGKLTLVWGGVRAAMQRLHQTDGIDIEAVYKHLAAHYKHFGKEAPPLRSGASFLTYNPATNQLEVVKNLDDAEKLNAYFNIIDNLTYDFKMSLLELVLNNLNGESNEETIYSLINALSVKLSDATKAYYFGVNISGTEEPTTSYVMADKNLEGGSNTDMENEKNVAEELQAQLAAKDEEIEALKAELERANRELETVRQEAEAIKTEYENFKAQVEAEKEEARLNALAEQRLAELVEAGIVLSDERKAKVKAELREMSDEKFADYKAMLLEIAQNTTAAAASAKNEEDDDLEISTAVLNGVKTTANVRGKHAAALNLETVNHSMAEKYLALFKNNNEK